MITCSLTMFKTMKAWNAERGRRSGRFYINVPVSLRPPIDFTASNNLGGITISPDPETWTTRDGCSTRCGRAYVFKCK